MIKTSSEIDSIREACTLGDLTFNYILKQIEEDVSEKQLASKIRHFIKSHGAKLSFRPIVAFGENALTIHHRPTDQRLKRPSFVLLDLGTKINDYCSDMTRTVFFGKPSKKQKTIYQTVLNAQQKAIDYINDVKNPCGFDVDKSARDFIIKNGFPSIPHSLGHGIGAKVHERPRISHKSKNILLDGMVFTIEPGIYIPELGGVRIEDTYTLQKGKLIQLTQSSKALIEI